MIFFVMLEIGATYVFMTFYSLSAAVMTVKGVGYVFLQTRRGSNADIAPNCM